jgi:hypothetical protein
MMLLNLYWNKKTGEVLIPSMEKAEAGFWLDVEPVERSSMSDRISLGKAIVSAFARSGKVVPTPPPNSRLKPVILAHSRARTWSAFARQYGQVSIVQSSEGTFTIEQYKPAPEGRGLVVDVEARRILPNRSSVDDLVAELNRLATEQNRAAGQDLENAE